MKDTKPKFHIPKMNTMSIVIMSRNGDLIHYRYPGTFYKSL